VGRNNDLNFENCTLEELRVSKRCAPTYEGSYRFLAIEFLHSGMPIEVIATHFQKSVRTIQRWIKLFNEQGLDGLAIKGKSGRPRKIPKEIFEKECVPLILEPSMSGQSHWTAVKFHGYLVQELQKELGYSTLLRYLHENRLSLVVPRSTSIKRDEEKRRNFLDDIKAVFANTENELWFQDESGFEGDPRPNRVWVKKGTKPRLPYTGDHLRFQAIAAVCPATGEFNALATPHADADNFQVFLDYFADCTKDSKKNIIMVLDNASWHKAKKLDWHHITPLYLPPNSPDFNPIETLWKVIKQSFFANWYATNIDQLIDRLCQALLHFMHKPLLVASITNSNHLVR
jgi:transposase